jgi:thermitase
LKWTPRLLAFYFVIANASALSAAPPPERVPGRLLVGYRESLDRDRIGQTLRLHRAIERRHVAGLRLAVVDVPEASLEAIRQSLQETGLFDYVEPDYFAHTASDPNDPSYISQWHLRKIGGPLAWTLTTGSASVVVAVVDSGVYRDHPDLSSKLVPGWNFVKGNADTSDILGHGTAVAGTVAAATNNGIGVAGVNWASRVMPLVVVDADDFAAYSDIAAAIQYAADHSVRIINVSIGGTNSSSTLQKAVDYAWSKGAMVFASAMNSGVSTPYYPAACTHAVAISATDSNDRLASFSNFGSWITLSAPGTNILTTANGGGYGFWNGTSFASPIAAGVAALILAANPALTNDAVLTLMKDTADRETQGFDPSLGWGRVNAYRAVLAAEPPHHRSGRLAPRSQNARENGRIR